MFPLPTLCSFPPTTTSLSWKTRRQRSPAPLYPNARAPSGRRKDKPAVRKQLSKESVSQGRQRYQGHGASLVNDSSSAPSFGLLAGWRPFCSANLQQGRQSASIPSLIHTVNKSDGTSRDGFNQQYVRRVCVYGTSVRLGGSSYIVNKLTLLLAWD